MAGTTASHETYRKVDIETASQGKLIVMLFNGAIQRAEEAKRALARGETAQVHGNLIRAQDIVSELRGALNLDAGDVAHNLNRIYEYFHHLLVKANIDKDATPIDHCVEMMTSMRDTWEEVFTKVVKDEPAAVPPPINVHGSSVMNLQG